MNNPALKTQVRTLVVSVGLQIAPIPALCTAGPWELGDSYRDGNTIQYTWTYTYDEEYVGLSMGFSFNRGWNSMQATYRSMGHSNSDFYTNLVKRDPFRADVDVVASVIRQLAREHGLDAAEVALSFVQSLPHDYDNPNYARYACEVLLDREGDCGDKSVLLLALLRELGYECVGLLSPRHMQVGIKQKSGGAVLSGEHYTYNGFSFYVAETTCSDCEIGDPRRPEVKEATIIPGYIRAGSIQGVEYHTPCGVCHGTGERRIGHGEHADTMPCSRCGGRGWY